MCRPVRAGLAATAIALISLAVVGPAQAQQTFTVTKLSGSGVAGDGSLRGEVLAANANPGADLINFAAGLSGTITLGAELQIKDPVDIEGPGPGQITVAQSTEKRVIHINLTNPGAVTIAGLHIADGTASGPGGNILNDIEHPASILTVVNCLITGGTASDYGGGIDGFGGSLTIRSTTLSGNHAIAGGGVWAGGQNVTVAIQDSTFSGNISTTSFAGGLILEMDGGSAAVTGSTFSGNQAKTEGGAISGSGSHGTTTTVANSTIFGNDSGKDGGGGIAFNGEPVLVESSTISANHSAGSEAGGGGISVDSNDLARLENTIVAGNSADSGGADLDGPINAAFSLIGNPSGATMTETVAGSNLIGADPQLGPLQNNGGLTATMAIPASSPAINRGSSALGGDQRGERRPVLYPGVATSAAPGANGADIGAFELQAPASPLPSNQFRFGKVKLNKKRGTATVAVILPGAGVVRLVGSKKVKKGSKAAKRAGTVKLVVKARGKALRSLKRKGKVKVKAKFTFTPTGGTSASRTKALKLVKRSVR